MPQKTRSKLPLQKLARVGTVTQGTQIATIAARAGYQATAFDPRMGVLHQAFERARGQLQGQEGQTKALWNHREACAAKMRQVQDLRETVQDAGLVLEAVSDEDIGKQVSNCYPGCAAVWKLEGGDCGRTQCARCMSEP